MSIRPVKKVYKKFDWKSPTDNGRALRVLERVLKRASEVFFFKSG